MRMHREAIRRRDAVIVDHAQRAESHVLRVVIFAKAEGVIRVEPVPLDVPAVTALADADHRSHAPVFVVGLGGHRPLSMSPLWMPPGPQRFRCRSGPPALRGAHVSCRVMKTLLLAL